MSKKHNKNKNNWRYKTGQHLIKKEPSFKKILYRDKRALKALYICGHVRRENLLKFIPKSRIETFEKDKLIEKVTSKNGKIVAYKFTKQGREFVNDQLGWQHAYVPKSLRHDLIIEKKFFQLSEEQQEAAKSEKEVKEELEYKSFLLHDDKQKTETLLKYIEEQTSPVDFMYQEINENTGEVEYVGFEAVTPNYSAEERQMKHNFCSQFGCRLEMRRS